MPIVELNWSGMDLSNMILIVVSRERFLTFLKVLRECFATCREICLLSHVGTLSNVRRHALSPAAFQHFLFFQNNKLTMQQHRSEDTLVEIQGQSIVWFRPSQQLDLRNHLILPSDYVLSWPRESYI